MTWMKKAQTEGAQPAGAPAVAPPAATPPAAAPAPAPATAAPAPAQAPQQGGQQQGYKVPPGDIVDLNEIYQIDPEFKELVDWLDGMRKLIGPYWEAQRMLQQKLSDLGITNLKAQAPEIAKLFKDLNG